MSRDLHVVKASYREWIGLAVIALPCLVYAMDLTILNLALPAISAELKPSSSQLLWIIDIYGFFVAAFLITMGNLGDRIGRRQILLIGGFAFSVASIIAAFSNSAGTLIAMRALLGVSGATLAPSTLSLIRNMFHDEKERKFAIGIWIASFSVGGAIGPLLGGIILEYYSWRATFLAAVPVMGALLIFGRKFLPEYRDPNAGKIDLMSVALSLIGTLSTIYGLKHAAEYGLGISSIVMFAIGVTLGVFFVRRQKILSYPLLDIKLFRLPQFKAAITAYGLSCLVMWAIYIQITQFLLLILGFSPIQAGLVTVPWSLAFMVGSLLAPKLANYYSSINIIVWGAVLAALGFLLVLFIDTPFGLYALIVGMIFMSLGISPIFTLGNEMIITSAPPERAGAASGISETCAEFCAAFGVAVLGSLIMIVYRIQLKANMPSNLSIDIQQEVMKTLGGAIIAAKTLHPSMDQYLLNAIHSAFSDGLKLIAGGTRKSSKTLEISSNLSFRRATFAKLANLAIGIPLLRDSVSLHLKDLIMLSDNNVWRD